MKLIVLLLAISMLGWAQFQGLKTVQLSSPYQGLEGGLAGVGQIDIRLPAETVAGRLWVQCLRAGGGMLDGYVPTGDAP